MTVDQIIPKTRDELLLHSAAKGRLTFVVGPYCYGKARAGHTAYGIARAHVPAFVTAPTFTVYDAPESATVDLARRLVIAPAGSVRVLGSF